MGRGRLTNILIAATEKGVAERVKALLHATGRPLLTLDVTADPAQLPGLVSSWQPDALLVERGIEVSGLSLPVVSFDPEAFDPNEAADRLLRSEAGPEASEPAPRKLEPDCGVAVGFQGIKGGVGTTTVACGMAVAARRAGYRVAVLDLPLMQGIKDKSSIHRIEGKPSTQSIKGLKGHLPGDCALTLRARADEEDPHLFVTDEGILVVHGPVDLNQIWHVVAGEYDVVVVDAGRVGEQVDEARALARRGVLFFLVGTPRTVTMLEPGRYPGYRLFLNRGQRGWWEWDVAGMAPDDPEVTGRVNRGEFGISSPFLMGMGEFTTRVMGGEVV